MAILQLMCNNVNTQFISDKLEVIYFIAKLKPEKLFYILTHAKLLSAGPTDMTEGCTLL